MLPVLVLSRAAPAASEAHDDPSLDEEHWSYMDAFADGMIARGPLLSADRSTWTGSVHILELPGAEAADDFVEREPYNRAGLYAQHVVLRFRNVLGRTMWEWRTPETHDDPLFLVVALVRHDVREFGVPVPALTRLTRERTIVLGELQTIGQGKPTGVVWALQASGRDDLEAVLDSWPAAHDERMVVEMHDWEFGGRR